MTSAAKRAKLKDDHSSGLIGRSLTNLRPEGWPSKPCGDVTLALPHARWIILLTGRYEPKKRKEKRKNGGRVHCFNIKGWAEEWVKGRCGRNGFTHRFGEVLMYIWTNGADLILEQNEKASNNKCRNARRWHYYLTQERKTDLALEEM